MIDAVKLVLGFAASLFKSRARLEVEVLVLRHQLAILRRKARRQPHLSAIDRLIFVWAYRLRSSVLDAICIVQPETVLRWHQAGFRWYWRWKSRSRGGELMMLGIEVAQSTVAKYMARRRRPPSHSWKAFLHNHAAGIAAMDLLVVPMIGLRLLLRLCAPPTRSPADRFSCSRILSDGRLDCPADYRAACRAAKIQSPHWC
jgi:hypothetical protein